MIDRNKRTEMIHAVSMDGLNRPPITVPRWMVGGLAWKIHKMKEVSNPNPEPVRVAPIVAAPVMDPYPIEMAPRTIEVLPEVRAEQTTRSPGRPRKTKS